MTIFGPDLSSLANQRMAYDQMGQQAAQADREAAMRAQTDYVNNVIQQRRDQQAMAQRQAEQDWQTQQNALQRQAGIQGEQIRAGAKGTEADRQTELDFRQAIRDAQNGLINPDRAGIATMYPHFTPDKIGVLYNLSGQAASNKAQAMAQQSAQMGQAPEAESILKSSGVPPPFQAQPLAFIQQQRKPFEEIYGQQSDLANRANLSARIAANTSTPPLPTTIPWYTGVNALLHPIAVFNEAVHPTDSPDMVIQPRGDWQSKAQAFAKSVIDPNTGTITKPYAGELNINAAGVVSPQAPPSWAPAFAQTATAPATTVQPSATPTAQPAFAKPTSVSRNDPQVTQSVAAAKSAIAKGASPEAVHARFMQKYGFDFN